MSRGRTILIRATHPYGFRYGHPHPWGVVRGVRWFNDRACFEVHFPQGNVTDYWPVYDENDPYEFRASQ